MWLISKTYTRKIFIKVVGQTGSNNSGAKLNFVCPHHRCGHLWASCVFVTMESFYVGAETETR